MVGHSSELSNSNISVPYGNNSVILGANDMSLDADLPLPTFGGAVKEETPRVEEV
jgi:hypothetical protein